MLGKRIINTGAAGAACTTDTVQILDGVPFQSIATYQLDGNANDLTTNYNGTASNVTYSTGKFGQAGDFNGSSSGVSLPNFMPSGNASRSVSMWIKTTTTAYSSLLRYGEGVNNKYFLFRVNTGNKLGVAFYANDYDVDVSSTGLFDGNWHQVAMTYDGSTIRLYVDGQEQGSGYNASATNTTASAARIGYQANPDGSSAGSYFNGSIDQVRVYDKAISAADVTTLYNETAATASTNITLEVPSLVAYYKMSDATDETGSYDGTPTNVNFNVAGKFGNAGEFNGSSSVIDFSQPLLINTFSVSFFIKTSNSSTQRILGNPYGGAGDYGFNIRTDSSAGHLKVEWSADGTNAIILDTGQSVIDGNWHHIVAVWSNGSQKIYIDNVEEASSTNANDQYATTDTFKIGANWNNTEWFNGLIDQIRIFDRAITSDEVTTLYEEVECVPTIVPTDHFEPVIYTGNGTTQSISTLDFQPDFVWIKDRDTTGESHRLNDSVRGVGKPLYSNGTFTEGSEGSTGLTAFNSNGFSIGNATAYNNLNKGYVAWNWKAGGAGVQNTDGTITSQVSANVDAGFSIVKFTGTGADATVGHGIDTPELIIAKRTDSTGNWAVQVPSIGNGYLLLNSTIGYSGADPSIWNNTAPTSNVFTTAGGSGEFFNTGDFIAYAFHSVDGMSKIGSYVGNGGTNSIVTGFRPAFVMIKGAVTPNATNWWIFDNKRNPDNPLGKGLLPNSSSAEQAQGTYLDFNSNGFTWLSGNGEFNDSGNTFIFMAFAEENVEPQPELANSFNTVLYTANGGTLPVTGVGFKPDLVWVKSRVDTQQHLLTDSVRGVGNGLISNLTLSEAGVSSNANGKVQSFDDDGFTVNIGTNNFPANNYTNDTSNGGNYVAWCWKASNESTINNNGSISSVVSANPDAGFSIVSYTGNGVAGATIGHGLNQAPELIIPKNRDEAQSWIVGADAIGKSYVLDLANPNAKLLRAGQYYYDWDDTTITTGSQIHTNGLNDKIIAYCFHSVDGYQKVGSYTGTNAPNNIVTTGFRPSWVMIKSTGATNGDWNIFDTSRENEPLGDALKANTSGAEGTEAAFDIDITDTGFVLDGASGAGGTGQINSIGITYIYLAIKAN